MLSRILVPCRLQGTNVLEARFVASLRIADHPGPINSRDRFGRVLPSYHLAWLCNWAVQPVTNVSGEEAFGGKELMRKRPSGETEY
jgi:hypothetical protein